MFKNIGLAVGILFCLSACLSNNYGPDITSKKINKSTGYSNDQVRRVFVDQPFLASGDYFLKREVAARTADHNKQSLQHGNQSDNNGNNQSPQAAASQQNRQYPRLISIPGTDNQQKQQKQYDNFPGQDFRNNSESMPFKIKVGILSNEELEGSSAMDELYNQAYEFFKTRPETLLISRIQIYQSFGQNQKTLNSIVLSHSEIPGNFSGLRNLLYINTLKIPDHYPGQAYFGMKLFDFGLRDGFTMPVFKSTVRNKADLYKFWKIVLLRVWNQVWKNDRILPWFTRVIHQDNDVIYIDAGRNSGLKIGQILKVMEPGRIIRSQTGVAIGWLPGKLKGKLQVKGFTGMDKSIVKSFSRFIIDKNDFIIVQQK